MKLKEAMAITKDLLAFLNTSNSTSFYLFNEQVRAIEVIFNRLNAIESLENALFKASANLNDLESRN